MLAATMYHSGILGLFTGLPALLVLAVLTSTDPVGPEGGSSTAFNSEWLARVPDDVRRMAARRGARRFLTLELLAHCSWECCWKFRDVIAKIRRGL